MSDPPLYFLLGWASCAAGLAVGELLAWWECKRRKAAKPANDRFEVHPTPIELETRRQMGIDYTGPIILFKK